MLFILAYFLDFLFTLSLLQPSAKYSFPIRIPTRYSKTLLAQGSGGYALPLYILLINAETL